MDRTYCSRAFLKRSRVPEVISILFVTRPAMQMLPVPSVGTGAKEIPKEMTGIKRHNAIAFIPQNVHKNTYL